MLTIDCQVADTKAQSLKVTSIMREVCDPREIAVEEKFEHYFSDQFTLEELIASCAVSGGIAFYLKYHTVSELTYIRVEKEDR